MRDLAGLAFHPITFPMIVGPGMMATAVVYARHATSAMGTAWIGAVIAAVLLILSGVLFFTFAFG